MAVNLADPFTVKIRALVLADSTFTRDMIAKRLNVSRATLNRWMTGVNVPRKYYQEQVLENVKRIVG